MTDRSQRNSGEVQRADPVARRRTVLIVLAGMLIGGLVISSFEHYRPRLERWLVSEPELLPERMATVTAALAFVTVVPLLMFAIRLWTAAAKARRYQRYPPEGERVVRDTPVLRGGAAVARGRTLQGLAIALVVFAIGFALALWRLASAIARFAA